MTELAYITDNLRAVHAEIRAAEDAVGREGHTTLLTAVKYATPEELEALLEAGASAVGENRVQQLLEHWPLYEKRGTKVHFIGSLQTNKVKYIIDKVDMIHSVDSQRLAEEISRRAAAKGLTVDVLVEINGAGEAAKSGVAPDGAEALCREVLQLPGLRLCGFMTMGPLYETAGEYQSYFASVKALGDGIWRQLALPDRPLYSMGMSQSFAPAIRAGADMVRVGRRLFVKA